MPQILGKEIGPIGFGLMGLTWTATPPPFEQAEAAMKAALASGCNFWNAGEFYGTPEYNSLHLLERYFSKHPEDAAKVVLSVKGGLAPDFSPDGSPEGIKRSVDNCLKLLNGKKSLDIFECARVDKNTPVETTMKALEEYIKAGKLGGISLSEVSAATIERAAKATKIVAAEVEISLWATDVFTNGVAKAAAAHNIPLIAYSPIGRGMLTGQIKSPDDIPKDDFRKTIPRFHPEHFDNNLALVRELNKIAQRNGKITPAQLAINWVRQKSKLNGNPEIIPIPGSRREEGVLENSKVIDLSADDLAEIDLILQKFEVSGTRYGGHALAQLEG